MKRSTAIGTVSACLLAFAVPVPAAIAEEGGESYYKLEPEPAPPLYSAPRADDEFGDGTESTERDKASEFAEDYEEQQKQKQLDDAKQLERVNRFNEGDGFGREQFGYGN